MPFRGGPEALTEVIAGRVEFYFCPINTALPYIREGKLVALVTSATDARAGAAGRADHARGRLPERRLPDLDRHAGAGQDAARDRRAGSTPKPSRRSGCRPSQERLGKTGVAPLILTPANSTRASRRRSPPTARSPRPPASSRTDDLKRKARAAAAGRLGLRIVDLERRRRSGRRRSRSRSRPGIAATPDRSAPWRRRARR